MFANFMERLSGWIRPRKRPVRRTERSGVRSSAPGPGATDHRAAASGDSLRRMPTSSASGAVRSDDPSLVFTPDIDDAVAPGLEVVSTREELRRRTQDLEAFFRSAAGRTDLKMFLDTLRRPASSVIRQPPLAAQAVLAVCRRRNYNLRELTRLLERDPAMSQALLRHSNSAFYATPGAQPILGIGAAVQRVGTKGVHATVMSRIIQGELSRPGLGYDQPARMVWEHMIRTAPLARRLGRAYGADPEEAFTLGLLHDVGKLVFFDRIADLRKRKRRDIVLPRKFLSVALACLHEPLGGLAALEWGLDERSATIIATHHRSPPPRPDDMLSQAIHLAERIDLAAQRGETLDLDEIWRESALTAPRAPVEAILEETEEEAA